MDSYTKNKINGYMINTKNNAYDTYADNVVNLMLEHDILFEDQIEEYKEYFNAIDEA